MAFELGNVIGFLGFLSLIPLIILYLIKPRPVNLKVPSLMFFFSREKSTTAESILRHFHEDLLFLVQLLVLSLLAFSLTQPLLTMKRDAASSNIVFILDTSASSQVLENGKTRFEISKERIEDMATTKNSLILVKSNPVLALQGVGRSELVRYINRLQPSDDISDISAAVVFGAELLSDMISSKGIPVDLSKKIVESKGIPVDLINTGSGNGKNIGIINMALAGNTVNLYIKNYNNFDEELNLLVGEEVKKLNIKAGSVEPFVFNLLEGDTKVEIQNLDDLYVDNKVIITKPYGEEIKVMLISSNPSKFLNAVLNSIESVKLTVAEPPVIPSGDYDLYIIDNVNKESLLAGTFEDLKKKVENGKGNLIVISWIGIENIDFKDILPAKLSNQNGGFIEINQITKFTKDIEFGEVKTFYPVNSGLSIASSNNGSIISLIDKGQGKIFYYGITDSESDFKLSPNYPIFWNNLISYMAGRLDLNELNLRAGGIFEVSNVTSINLDKTGVFNAGNKKISVNLLNEKESEINLISKDLDDLRPVNYKLKSAKVEVDYNLEYYLILIVLLLVIFEFGYIKLRGEIWSN